MMKEMFLPFLFIALFSLTKACARYNKVGKSQIIHPPAEETIGLLHKKVFSLNHDGKDFLPAVQSLISRVLIRAGVSFTFKPLLEIIPSEEIDGQFFDVFEIDQKDNQIVFRGSNGVALSTAFGHYLRYYTNSDFHWEDGGGYSFQSFPTSLDSLPIPPTKERIVFLSKWRYYQNTCTFSYSYVWKNWNQWEADIDWMAMNGFNLPLAFTGQEIVWQELWKTFYNISNDGLNEYFTGPAFLTWQRMANIRAYAGPLSQDWINSQASLQKLILQRFSDLGMTPVMPAFNGVVPKEMSILYPQANITQLNSWNNFNCEEYSCNYILSSTDPLFIEIGSQFLNLQFKIWGEELSKSHIYNCDTFNENKPASNDYEYLSSSSAAVYNSMIQADPDAVWLMQGWLFVNDLEFWTDENIQSYLAGVPDDGMVILDLSSEDVPVWDKLAANKKQFIWCMLHNYGGRRAIYGNLTLLSIDPVISQQQVPNYFLGTGLTMEAIDQNPVMYEFMSEMAWNRKSPNVTAWVENYAIRRYGLTSSTVSSQSKELAIASWIALYHNNYNGESPICHQPCDRRSLISRQPSWSLSQVITMKSTPLVDIWTTLLYTNLTNKNIAYTYDLVDIGQQVMTNLFYDYYNLAKTAYLNSDLSSFLSVTTDILELLKDWDKLLSSHQSFLLGKWIAGARSWAKDAEEGDLFDFNARNQVTLWGDNGEINDYAAKNWGGLAKGYYLKRWQLWVTTTITALQTKTPVNIDDYNKKALSIGQEFCVDYKTTFSSTPIGDSVKISHEMHDKYGNTYAGPHMYILQKDKDIEGYDVMPTPTWTKNLKQLQRLCDAAYYCVGFTTEGLLKTNSSNMIDRPGVHTFLKGKCSTEKCGN